MNNGNAANVVFYQLTGTTNFQRAPIETFWRNDREALANELVGSGQQVFLYPGQQKQIALDLSEETRYLGVAANLRAPEPNRWRRALSLQQINGRRVAVQVSSNSLTVALQAE